MLRIIATAFVCIAIFPPIFAQNKDTASVSLYNSNGLVQVYRLREGNTFSYRGTGTFNNMTSWNSTAYTEGYLEENFDPQQNPANAKFKMNYRLLPPLNYDENYSQGYPLILMLHGAGERGNCWNSSCYYSAAEGGGLAWDPNVPPLVNDDPRLLNNDLNLVHGGKPHLDARNLAAGKLPNDPTLSPRAFPGFVLFPQNLNGWIGAGDVAMAIRILRLVIRQYNIDEDRIYVHGLSNGGQGTYHALNLADWLFAAAAPMSAISSTGLLEVDSAVTVPIWVFQGGKDGAPTPATTESLVRNFRKAGGSARYTKYANLGHGVWNSAYAEPDFFSWLLSNTKRQIHAYFDSPNICATSGAGARLALAQGFPAYQWELDGQIIPGATSDQYVATVPGTYRARFSRIANPSESEWNFWSDPVVVGESSPPPAEITQFSTTYLPGLNNAFQLTMKAEGDFAHYYWYKNGIQFNTGQDQDTIQYLSIGGACVSGTCANNGTWTLKTAGFDNCLSVVSDDKHLFFSGQPAPPSLPIPTPALFQAKITSPTSVLMTWADASNLERGYELWRKKTTETIWQVVVLGEDVVSYHDTNLDPNGTYWYKVRAISSTATSHYAPANDKTSAAACRVVTFGTETAAPTPPQNLTAELTQVNTITLDWEQSGDNSGIKEYVIYYESTEINTHSTNTSYTLTGLPVNTTYHFTIRSIDKAGNLSPPSNEAIESTYMTGLFYRHSNAAYLDGNGTPDIRLVPWPAPWNAGATTPSHIKTNVTVNGAGPTYNGTFLNTDGQYVMYQTVFFRNNGNGGPIFAHVDSNENIIRDSDGSVIGSCNLFAVPATYTFTETGLSSPRVDYIITFVPENNGTAPYFSTEYPPNGPLTQDDFFIIDYDGYLYINNAGNYRFQTVSDDALQLYVDGVLRLADNQGQTISTTVENTATMNSNLFLSSGPHRIVVRFMEYAENHRLTVRYRAMANGLDLPNNGTYFDIPASALKSGNEPIVTPPAAPLTLSATGVSMTQNDLSWTGGGLKVVVLGSSTAVGTGATAPIATNGWVGQFTTWLNTNFPGSTVSNLAVGGYTTNSILPGVNPSNNITAALALNPNLIIINLPSNDVEAGISNTTTMNNYNTVKALADARRIPIYFTTTQPRNFASLATRQLLQTQANSIRTAFGTHVIDIYDELAETDLNIKASYSFGDGIHVNDAGHAYIFTTARDLLAPVLPTLRSFTVHRATGMAGPYSHINTVSDYDFSDTGLTPGTTYYYKIKVLDVNGTSDFSPVASATTLTDSEAPSQPTGLAVTASTFANVSLVWNASTDNVLVTHYDIYANGIKIGSSEVPGYLATDLVASTVYNFTVKAVDASNNESVASAGVNGTTGTPTTYYSKSSGNLNTLATWGNASDGSGTSPASFSANGQYYSVSNRPTSSLGASWSIEGSISKVIIPDGVAFTNDNLLDGRLEVQGAASLILQNVNVPDLVALSPSSTVEYAGPTFITKGSYGNLVLSGTGYKTFADDTTWVSGNITAAAGIAMRGKVGNTSTVALQGNLTINGIPGVTPPDFSINLLAASGGTQSVTAGGDMEFNSINTSPSSVLNVNNTGSPLTVTLGSLAGGGLSLANGSQLNVGTNSLKFVNAAAINSGGESGKIGIAGGSIDLNSTSALDSRFHFDGTSNSIARYSQNLTGAGKAFFMEPAKIEDAIKISNGEMSAGGNITLLSTATKTANIEAIEGSGLITGDMKVQRYVTPKGKIYRYISSPVEGVTVADWQQFFPITGNFTGYTPGFTTNPSMFYYNEPAGGWLPYPAPSTTNQEPIVRGVGYSPFLRNGNLPITMEVTGNPYQGDINFTITPDPNAGNADDGYNLVGNPYASTINWGNDNWTKTGISNTIAVRDNPSGQFHYYFYDPNTGMGFGDAEIADGNIAPGQAFWVQAVSTSPALSITEQAKAPEQMTLFRTAASIQPHMKVSLLKGADVDPAYLLFTSDGTTNFDAGVDAPKRPNDLINFSTLSSDGISLAINNIGDFCSYEIPIKLANTPVGTYSIQFEEYNTSQEIGSILLHDQFAGNTVDLMQQSDYQFDVTSAPASFENRFKITLSRPGINEVSASAVEVCDSESVRVDLPETQAGALYKVFSTENGELSDLIESDGSQLSLLIPKNLLTAGENHFIVKSAFPGCALINASSEVNFMFNPNPAAQAADAFSICIGDQVTITADGAPEGGHYNWYNSNLDMLESVHDTQFVTNPVKQTDTYYVAAVNASNCEGPRKLVTITPENVPVPEILEDGEQLVVESIGSIQWYLGNSALVGENGNTITPTANGEYFVTATVGGCTQTSSSRVFAVTGLEESGTNQLVITPNPTQSDNINLLMVGINGPVDVKLTSSIGKTYYSNSFNQSAGTMVKISPTERLAAGIYFVRVANGTNTWVKKVVIGSR